MVIASVAVIPTLSSLSLLPPLSLYCLISSLLASLLMYHTAYPHQAAILNDEEMLFVRTMCKCFCGLMLMWLSAIVEPAMSSDGMGAEVEHSTPFEGLALAL